MADNSIAKPWYKRWWAITLGVFIGLSFVLSLLPSDEKKDDSAKDPAGATQAAEPQQKTTSEPEPVVAAEPEPKPKSLNDKLRDALDKTDGDVQKIGFGRSLHVTLKTPEGGFDGPSTGDLNREAGQVFQAVYGKVKYPAKSETVVVFRGGLADTATGKDLPDAKTGIFTLNASDAEEINWSDDSVNFTINWTLYRDFVHPALKQDD